MAKIDLSKMDLDELKTLKKDVTKAIDDFQVRRRKEALAAAEKAAKESGFSLEELLGKKAKGRSAGTAPAKYRHPENPDMTWSGRGRRPRWVSEMIDAGKSLEDCAI